MTESLSLKKRSILAICFILVFSIGIAIIIIHMHFKSLTTKTIDHRTKTISEIFLKQNGNYLNPDHINFLKLNLNQQLRYSNLDYIGIWDENAREIIKVGDGGLTKKIQALVLRNKEGFRIKHLDSNYYLGKVKLKESEHRSFSFLLYSFDLQDVEINLWHSEMIMIGILSLFLWIAFVVLIMLNHSWKSLVIAEANKPKPIVNKVAIVRKVLSLLFREFDGTIQRINMLRNQGQDKPFSQEEMDLLLQNLFMKGQGITDVAKDLELLSVTTALRKQEVSIRDLLLKNLKWSFELDTLNAEQKTGAQVEIKALTHPMIYSSSEELTKILKIIFGALVGIYVFDDSLQISISDGLDVSEAKIEVVITANVNLGAASGLENKIQLKIYLAEIIADLIGSELTLDIVNEQIKCVLSFQKGKQEDTTMLPLDGVWSYGQDWG